MILVNAGRLIFDGTPDELRHGGSLEEPFYRLTNYGRPPGVAEAEEPAPVVTTPAASGIGEGGPHED